MNVVIAIDSFKGSMTSLEAGKVICRSRRAPLIRRCRYHHPPAPDGGEGTVDALTLGCGGTCTQVCVTGPLGETGTLQLRHSGCWKNCSHRNVRGCRNYLLSETERNPLYTTTYGRVGKSSRDAIARGLQTFYYRNQRKCHKRWRNRYAAGTGI